MHFLFQTDEYCVIPVQGNNRFANYASDVKMDGNLLARNPKTGHCGQSQAQLNNIIMYRIHHHNLSCDNSPGNYNFCRSTNDPNFSKYHSLMAISYSDCDKIKLEYDVCQYNQNIFNVSIMDISNS